MIKYKSNPFSPLSNKSFLKKNIQNDDTNEDDDQYINHLFSSIDFNLLEKSNEDIDLLSLKQMLYNLLILLKSGISLTDFPEILIPRIIDLSYFYQSDQDLASFSINFIYFLCKLDDSICFNYIDEQIINFFYNIIDLSFLLDDIKVAFSCLINLTSSEKQQTSTKLNSSLLIQKTIDFLQKIKQNFDLNNQTEYEEIIYLLFELIANCLLSFNFSENEIENISQQMFVFLCPLWQGESEINDKVNRIVQISASQAMSKVIFWKSKSNSQTDISYLDQIMKDEILDLFINLIKSDYDFELEKLAINIFHIFEILSFINMDFSLRFISHPSSPIFFQPPEDWGIKSKSIFCKSIISSVGKLRECRELNKGDEYLDSAMEQLRAAVADIVTLMIDYISDQGYKLRKAATMVLCQLITLNDSQILSILLVGQKNIIDDFIFFLDDDVKEYLTYSLIKSMRVLCLYGDLISQESRIPNPFLEVITESDINLEEVLDKCAQKYTDSKKITLIIDDFKKVIQKCFICQDIDQELEEEFELFI